MSSAIQENHEKYLTVSATIYSMCLETFKTINNPGISSKMAEKILLETVTLIAKRIASCENLNLEQNIHLGLRLTMNKDGKQRNTTA